MVEQVKHSLSIQKVGISITGRVKPMTYKIDAFCFLPMLGIITRDTRTDWLGVRTMNLSGILGHGVGSLVSRWDNDIKSPSARTVTSQYLT